MSRKDEPGRKWTKEQKQAAQVRSQARWATLEYREKQLGKLAVAQKKAAEQRRLYALTKPIRLNGSRLMRQRLAERDGNKCYKCGQGPVWNDEPLTFQSHHIDSEKLALICPNCHSQTHHKQRPKIVKNASAVFVQKTKRKNLKDTTLTPARF